MFKILKKAERDMLEAVRFNADDEVFVKTIEDQTAEAMKMRDPIDRYLALEKMIDGSSHKRRNRDKERNVKRIYGAAKDKIENKYGILPVVFSSYTLSIVGGALIWGWLGGLIGLLAGSFIVGVVEDQKKGFIDRKLNRANVKATDILRESRKKIECPLDKILQIKKRIRDTEPQVAEYLELKKNRKLSDLDIREMAAKKFPPKPITPDDLSVTLPESGAAKPRIRLKNPPQNPPGA